MIQKRPIFLSVLVFGLYLAQGVPLGLIFQAYPVILRQAGVGLETLAWLPLAMLPWLGKLLWAPWVENHYWRTLGRRKSWILPLQFVQLAVLLLLALVPLPKVVADGEQTVQLIIGLMIVLGFSSATQDIATDGLAAENCKPAQLPLINSLQVAGIMLGMLCGGPLVMWLSDSISTAMALTTVAAITLLTTLPLLMWSESSAGAEGVAIASLKKFLKRPGSIKILLMSCTLTMSCAVAYNLAKYILLDAGWQLGELALLSAMGNILMVVFGSLLAAVIMARFSRWFCIGLGLASALLSLSFWLSLVLGWLDANAYYASLAIGFGGLAIGLCTAAIYALLMAYAQSGEQPATDFSVFQSLQSSSEMVVMSLATFVAAKLGFSVALLLGVILLVLATILVRQSRRRNWLA